MKKRRRRPANRKVIGYAAGGEVGTAMAAGTSDPAASTGAMPRYPVSDPMIMSMSLDARASNPANYNTDKVARATRPAQAPVVPPQYRFEDGGEVEDDSGASEDSDDDDEKYNPTWSELPEEREEPQEEEEPLEPGDTGALPADDEDLKDPDEENQPQAAKADDEEKEPTDRPPAEEGGGGGGAPRGGGGGGESGGGEGGGGGMPEARAQDFGPSHMLADESQGRPSQWAPGGVQTGFSPGAGAMDKPTTDLRDVLSYTQQQFGLSGSGRQALPQTAATATAPQQEEPQTTERTGYFVPEGEAPAAQAPVPTGYAQRAAPMEAPQTPTERQPQPRQGAFPQQSLQAMLQGQGGLSPEAVTQLMDQTTGEAHRGDQNRAIYRTVDALVQRGDIDMASKFVQSLRPSYDKVRGVMMAALTQGDMGKALELASKLNDLVPNGRKLDFHQTDDGNITAVVHAPDGRVTSFAMTPEQFQQYAAGPASLFDVQGSQGLEQTLAQLTGSGGTRGQVAGLGDAGVADAARQMAGGPTDLALAGRIDAAQAALRAGADRGAAADQRLTAPGLGVMKAWQMQQPGYRASQPQPASRQQTPQQVPTGYAQQPQQLQPRQQPIGRYVNGQWVGPSEVPGMPHPHSFERERARYNRVMSEYPDNTRMQQSRALDAARRQDERIYQQQVARYHADRVDEQYKLTAGDRRYQWDQGQANQFARQAAGIQARNDYQKQAQDYGREMQGRREGAARETRDAAMQRLIMSLSQQERKLLTDSQDRNGRDARLGLEALFKSDKPTPEEIADYKQRLSDVVRRQANIASGQSVPNPNDYAPSNAFPSNQPRPRPGDDDLSTYRGTQPPNIKLPDTHTMAREPGTGLWHLAPKREGKEFGSFGPKGEMGYRNIPAPVTKAAPPPDTTTTPAPPAPPPTMRDFNRRLYKQWDERRGQ